MYEPGPLQVHALVGCEGAPRFLDIMSAFLAAGRSHTDCRGRDGRAPPDLVVNRVFFPRSLSLAAKIYCARRDELRTCPGPKPLSGVDGRTEDWTTVRTRDLITKWTTASEALESITAYHAKHYHLGPLGGTATTKTVEVYALAGVARGGGKVSVEHDQAWSVLNRGLKQVMSGTGAGSLWGRGAYCSPESCKAVQYTDQDAAYRYVVVMRCNLARAWVAEGSSCPSTDALFKTGYHSVVVSPGKTVSHHWEFVGIHDNQFLPVALLELADPSKARRRALSRSPPSSPPSVCVSGSVEPVGRGWDYGNGPAKTYRGGRLPAVFDCDIVHRFESDGECERCGLLWQSDDSSEQCMECFRPFSFFIRRHHCRRCGRLICSQCLWRHPVWGKSCKCEPACYVSRLLLHHWTKFSRAEYDFFFRRKDDDARTELLKRGVTNTNFLL